MSSEKTVYLILFIVCVLVFIWFTLTGIDMLRFRRAQKEADNPKAAHVRAGGILYLNGNKTYYQMPKGTVRKIADYPMDLRRGSVDMNRFLQIMDQAETDHARDVQETKIKADEAMRAVAKEEVRE